MITIAYAKVRRTNQNMTVTEYVNTPSNPNRTSRSIKVDVEINTAGRYAAVLPYGRNWQPTIDNALGCASFVLGRPVVLGRTSLVE